MSISIVMPRVDTSDHEPRATADVPSSCLSFLNPSHNCGDNNWNYTQGVFTACCDGDIIDPAGSNRLGNLICCPGVDLGPSSDGIQTCPMGNGRYLSDLLETSTEVAKPWTTTVGGQASTVQPECFWSQLSRGQEAPWIASSATSSGVSGAGASVTVSSSGSVVATSTASVSSGVANSLTGSASATAATGSAVAVTLPRWVALGSALALVVLAL